MSPRCGGDNPATIGMNLWAKLGIATLIGTIYLLWADVAAAYEPWWVQNHVETELWSGPDGKAVTFQRVPQWSYFQVVEPQGKNERLYVRNPKTSNYAYINAKDVGPSGQPPEETAGVGSSTQAGKTKPNGLESIVAIDPWWGETQVTTELWSGADNKSVSFGRVPRGTALQIVGERKGNRYYILNPASKNYAYVDADAIVKKAAPEAGSPKANQVVTGAARAIPQLADGYEGWWVANFRETELWSGPDSEEKSLGTMQQFRRFLVIEPQKGNRLKVWYPEKDIFGYMDARVVGPSCASVWVSEYPVRDGKQIQLPGRSLGEKTYVRNLPIYDDETELRKLPNNTSVTVTKSVVADDGTEWYVVGEGEYILASEIRLPRQPSKYLSGRWIDADLDQPAMVTAYEGNKVVMTTMAIKGINRFPTPQGNFSILRRVADETMDSETIGIPRDAPGGYLLKNVLYTQYFTKDGASLHYNYWAGTFGYPGSHGCLGLSLEDSKWFWEWANVGTPVVVRANGDGQMMQTGNIDR